MLKIHIIKNFFEKMDRYRMAVDFLIILLMISTVFIFWFGFTTIKNLNITNTELGEKISLLENKMASTTVEIQENIAQTETSLAQALEEEARSREQQLSGVQDKVGTISGTVTDLEKLSNTDPELLQKYSKVFFLNEHFAPAKLVEIPNEYKYYESRVYQLHDKVWPYLNSMLNSAKASGIDLYVYSAYRSFNTQEALKGQYTVIYGAGNQFSADQGYSEHQLGTTVDLITTGIGGTLAGFDDTETYNWLLQNAHKFGFTLSYPKNNGYYIYEPWHWRFVGVQLATDLKNQNKNFYDMNQRDIDEYLVNIFD